MLSRVVPPLGCRPMLVAVSLFLGASPSLRADGMVDRAQERCSNLSSVVSQRAGTAVPTLTCEQVERLLVEAALRQDWTRTKEGGEAPRAGDGTSVVTWAEVLGISGQGALAVSTGAVPETLASLDAYAIILTALCNEPTECDGLISAIGGLPRGHLVLETIHAELVEFALSPEQAPTGRLAAASLAITTPGAEDQAWLMKLLTTRQAADDRMVEMVLREVESRGLVADAIPYVLRLSVRAERGSTRMSCVAFIDRNRHSVSADDLITAQLVANLECNRWAVRRFYDTSDSGTLRAIIGQMCDTTLGGWSEKAEGRPDKSGGPDVTVVELDPRESR